MAPQTSTKLTYEDYLEIPNDGRRYEIIDGELFVNPASSPTLSGFRMTDADVSHAHEGSP